MRLVELCSYLVLAASIASPTAAGEPVGWIDLIDKAAQHYEDPYRALQPRQLKLLISVGRLRERLATNLPADEERSTIEQKLRSREAKLAAEGINIDWLISQRWGVAKRRKRAAIEGNKELDGQVIIIAGFAIPAPADPDGTRVAYLVPERGMCSHMPPPQPNQMIRLRLKKGWAPDRLHEPVRVRGTLRIAPSEHHTFMVDGRVPLHSTFVIEDARAVPIGIATPAPAGPKLGAKTVRSKD